MAGRLSKKRCWVSSFLAGELIALSDPKELSSILSVLMFILIVFGDAIKNYISSLLKLLFPGRIPRTPTVKLSLLMVTFL